MGFWLQGLYSPIGESLRKTTSECWSEVPPSAHIRKYFPSILYRCGPSIQMGFVAGSTPLFTMIFRSPMVQSFSTSYSTTRIVRWPSYSGLPPGASSLFTM